MTEMTTTTGTESRKRPLTTAGTEEWPQDHLHYQQQALKESNKANNHRQNTAGCLGNNTSNKRPRKYTKPRPWNESFSLLVAYREKYGHCNTPYYYAPDRYLGDWVAKQRKNRDNPKLLSQEQRDRLDEIGFEWCSTQDRIWNEKFARLETYFQTHGSCVVPTNYSDGNGTDLANWVAKQRQIHAQGRMTHERYEKLQAIQFVWRIKQYSTKEKDRDSTREDQKWTEKYERLVAFQKEFGTCAVPFQYEKDKSLGRWVNEQRTQNTRDLLRADRKELLNKLDFLWRINTGIKTAVRVRPEQTLLDGVQQQPQPPKRLSLAKQQKQEPSKTSRQGVSNPTPEIVSDDTDKENSLPPITNIEVIALSTDYKKETFETMFRRLVDFQREYGHVSIPSTYTSLGLGPWIAAMKQQAREGILKDDKASKLRTVGVIVQGEDEIWMEQFYNLRSYIQQHGHSFVSTLDDPGLAVWTASQRFLYRQKRLLPDRKARLDAIRFHFQTPEPRPGVHFVSSDEESKSSTKRNDCDGDDVDLHTLEGGIFAAACMWNA